MSTEETKPALMFPGRFSPFHRGHAHMMEQAMEKYPGHPLVVLVRNTSYDEFSASERVDIIRAWAFARGYDVTIKVIPDIVGVFYGRGVGFTVEEMEPPKDIAAISATRIREGIKAEDSAWEQDAAYGTAGVIKEIVSRG